ncbi:toxin-activating lysine-acyltransferase [Nioella halotolerans]|uniref:toxin-activating lysine-acyltransferase n=1 Tax=Nioella halotolerans TaxID=2303578 RepID=UPI0026806005
MTENHADPITSLAHMLWLTAQTSNISRQPIGDIASGCQFAINQGQFRIYRSAEGQPLGCVCWIWLHKEHEETAAAAMLAAPFGTMSLQEEWIGGDRLWFYNFIAPFGHARVMANDLRHSVFPGVDARALRMDKRGNLKHFALFQNVDRRTNAASE